MRLIDDMDLVSEDTLVVLSSVPSWTVRRGLWIVFALFSGTLALCSWIQIPETVEAKVKLANSGKFRQIYPGKAGYLEVISVSEKQQVKKGQLLAKMQNHLDNREASELREILTARWEGDIPGPKMVDRLHSIDSLYNLQNEIDELAKQLNLLHERLKQDSINTAQDYFRIKSDRMRTLILLSKQELALKQKESNLARESFQTDSTLYEDSVISLSVYRSASRSFLAQQANIFSLAKHIKSQELQLLEFRQQQFESKTEQQNELETNKKKIMQIRSNLLHHLARIEAESHIYANASGAVHLHKNTEVGNRVDINQSLMAIDVAGENWIGVSKVQSRDLEKIKLGQRALIELDAYSKEEYGQLQAELIEIGELLSEDGYQIKLKLDTPYPASFRFKAQMRGKVQLIGESKTLLERIFKKSGIQ